jgi:2'-hydroxyisoflavone reductase
VEEVNGETYGPLKVLCEQAVEATMPGRALTIRPGLIVGPHDPTDRFTYWVERVAEGGDVLAPGRPERRIEFIDVRDLAEWTVKMVEQGHTGTFNATGPDYPLPMGRFLDESVAVSGSGARLVWIDEPFLLERGVAPWSELPLWIPEDDQEHANLLSIDCRKAIRAGLTFRPLADTIRDTLSWASTLPSDRERRAGPPREREQELLAAWHGTEGNG